MLRLPVFFFNDTATTEIYTLSLHDALPISEHPHPQVAHHTLLDRHAAERRQIRRDVLEQQRDEERSEEHTSELQSRLHLVCRLLLEKKKKQPTCYNLFHIYHYNVYIHLLFT